MRRASGNPGRLTTAAGDGAWVAMSAAADAALALRLDRRLRPAAALHGPWLGIGSCLEVRGDLLLACRESNVLIVSEISPATMRR